MAVPVLRSGNTIIRGPRAGSISINASRRSKVLLLLLLLGAYFLGKQLWLVWDRSPQDAIWKQSVLSRLGRIRAQCGKLCQNAANQQTWLANSVAIPGANVRMTIVPDLDCQALMANKDIDAGDTSIPYPLPEELISDFTMGGASNLHYLWRYKNVYLGGEALQNVWTKQMVDTLVHKLKTGGRVPGTYGSPCTYKVKDRLSELDLVGKHCLVIGSEKPWLEAVLLSLGAARVTTLEYGAIESQHPQIDTMTPDQMRQRFSEGTQQLFDVVVTHSSVEHSGLGRYGDALNPWGDLQAIARAWCVSKPDAQMYIGVPFGRDRIEFNAHRVYGKMRWSLLATNWKQIDGSKHTNGDFEANWFTSHICGGTGLLFQKVEKFDEYATKLQSSFG